MSAYTVVGNYLDPDEGGGRWQAEGLTWDHIRTRHVALHGQWIVWDGSGFRVETPESFAAYTPVPFEHTDTPDSEPTP